MQLTNERGQPKSQREREKKSHGNHSQVCPIEIELVVEMIMYLHFLTRFYLLHVVSLKSRAATYLIFMDGLSRKNSDERFSCALP